MSVASICLRQSSKRSCQTQVIHFSRRHRELPAQSRYTWPSRSFYTSRKCHQPASASSGTSKLTPVETRIQKLSELGFQDYPRSDEMHITHMQAFKKSWKDKISAGETDRSGEPIVVVGRVASIRIASSKLVFIDLRDHAKNQHMQIVVNNGQLEGYAGLGSYVKPFTKLVQRGDIISVTGRPHRTETGALSLLATAIPRLLTPCLHQIPTTAFGDDSDLAHERHVEMLTDPSVIETIVARSAIISAIQTFLRGNHFVNVQTPILAASAGGAIARSFETKATEFSHRKLALRIAPELWLKRLIVGGLQRVYELGPSFRNEGLDKTHNPEFTTCEFYAAGWTLSKLQTFTQSMIRRVASQSASQGAELDETFKKSIRFEEDTDWRQIDFIPAINAALGTELPDLSSATARQKIVELFRQQGLALPSTPTLPRLLDKLCSIYIEPNCDEATWIVNTPECLSPLAKSFYHPDLPNQRVAARAELFIHGKEVVNCYEEENSPVEQRRKFVGQQEHAQVTEEESGKSKDDEAMQVDEDYLRALEWGLPPTGGWGCGIDRLVMLMLGKDKISDVLTFGNLRMVTRHAERVATTDPS